jgi:hypothetical protein
MAGHYTHESVHVKWDNIGANGDPLELNLNEYVDVSLEEEADAFGAEIEFYKHSGVPSHVEPEVVDAYNQGYLDGRTEFLNDNPNATEEEIASAGEDGARESIKKFFYESDFGGYRSQFEEAWRKARGLDGVGSSEMSVTFDSVGH